MIIPSTINSTSFNFSSFVNYDPTRILLEYDSFLTDNAIQLTRNATTGSVGRATYSNPIRNWDLDFETQFSFVIETANDTESGHGDGITFFLAPFRSKISPESGGGFLGLMSADLDGKSTTEIVAVEFDTFQNQWDPSPNHVGININSITSVASMSLDTNSTKYGAIAHASISYNSSMKNLSVTLIYDHPGFGMNSKFLHHIVDLAGVLPEWITVGFSAASTGRTFDHHKILSWKFNSSFKRRKGINTGLVVGLVIGLSVLGPGLAFAVLIWWKKRGIPRNYEHHTVINLLRFETPLPRLPLELPTPVYLTTPNVPNLPSLAGLTNTLAGR
ncbi:hypothetical protein MKX03_034625 [Papaver bracteatum]|nr:hypothetical protein MKX03_034625 [Papaver bracteatum]